VNSFFDSLFPASGNSCPIFVVSAGSSLENLTLSAFQLAWLNAQNFEIKPGKYALIPGPGGELERVIYVNPSDPWDIGRLVDQLPEGVYRFDDKPSGEFDLDFAYLAWGMASYRFDRFTQKPAPKGKLLQSPVVDNHHLSYALEAIFSVRDWVNLPAESFGPEEIQAAMAEIADEFETQGALLKGIVGDDLLHQNFPAIHAVGRAATASRAPRLLHLSWGNSNHPALCLVGKGVCFDTGGLNIKNATGMATMKKDMGGAAHAIALGRWIMRSKLPVNLHIIVPAVENAISSDSYRPGDVVKTRQGLTIEIGNTDAEGRVILSDALAYAEEFNPALLIDFATLTGAARVALGPELPALYASDSVEVEWLLKASQQERDPLWQLPLYQPYRDYFKSDIADLSNDGQTSYAGSIIAALFLQSFVKPNTKWVHVDVMAWNPASKPARPKGGEAQGLRAFYAWIESLSLSDFKALG
jgi:leucyl aminopeptidase